MKPEIVSYPSEATRTLHCFIHQHQKTFSFTKGSGGSHLEEKKKNQTEDMSPKMTGNDPRLSELPFALPIDGK